MASPKPGVSTTVNRSLTPRSSISTVDASNWTVFFFSNFSAALGTIRSVKSKTGKECFDDTNENDTLNQFWSSKKRSFLAFVIAWIVMYFKAFEFQSTITFYSFLLPGYKSVRKRELIRVDFPKPASPTTISVNSNPFLTDFR